MSHQGTETTAVCRFASWLSGSHAIGRNGREELQTPTGWVVWFKFGCQAYAVCKTMIIRYNSWSMFLMVFMWQPAQLGGFTWFYSRVHDELARTICCDMLWRVVTLFDFFTTLWTLSSHRLNQCIREAKQNILQSFSPKETWEILIICQI